MLNRFIFSLNQIFNFVRNPSAHFTFDNSDTKALRDIAAVIIFLGLTIQALITVDDAMTFGVMLVVTVLLSWPFSWLVLNVGAYIFEYYLEWVAYKQIVPFEPNLLKTQRIVTYCTVTLIVNVIPVTYASYIGAAISILLTSLGLRALYNLEFTLGLAVTLVYQLLLYAFIYVISYAIRLMV